MNPLCIWWSQVLARQAAQDGVLPRGSRLEAHAARCPRCGAEWRALRRLAFALAHALDAPAAPQAFMEKVWARVDAAAPVRKARQRIPILSAAAACAMVLFCWIGQSPLIFHDARKGIADASFLRKMDRRVIGNGTVSVQDRRTLCSGIEIPACHYETRLRGFGAQPAQAIRRRDGVPPSNPQARDGSGFVRADRQFIGGKGGFYTVSKRIEMAAWRAKPKSLRRHRSAWKAAPVKTAAPPRPAPVLAQTPPKRRVIAGWKEWGAWYESWGDYRRASVAYGRALQEKTDDSLAFAAGRTAECAGDVAQALGYYATLLENRSGKKPQPEKGSRIWNDDFVTA